MILPSILLTVTFSLVQLEGEATCPTLGEVGARLKAVLPEGGDPQNLHRIRVEATPTGVRIELRDATGALLGERSLETTADCRVRAAAVATIIAAWEIELQAGLQLAPREPTIARPIAEPARPSLQYRLEGAVVAGFALGSGAASGPAIGGSLAAMLAPAGSHFGGVLGFSALSPRDIPLGHGVARWERVRVDLGAEYRASTASFDMAVRLAASGCAYFIQGIGFQRDASDQGFDPGVSLGLRVGKVSGSRVAWLGVSASYWPVSHEIILGEIGGTGIAATQQLPQVELFGEAGIGFAGP